MAQNDPLRARIRVEDVLDQLNGIACGEISASGAVVNAALGLLRKVLPDLSAIAVSGEVDLRMLSDEELRERLRKLEEELAQDEQADAKS